MSADDKNLVPAVSPEERELDDTFVMGTYGRLPVEFVGGHGATLVDAEGNEYLDLLGGIGCASLGYGHPAVVEALREQAGRIWQVGNYFYVEHRGELAAALSALLSTTTDEGGHEMGSTGTRWKTFFSNSGAEANEGALKLARRWGEKNLDGASTIVTARKSFHGRTLATLAATGQDKYHRSFRPLPEGFVSVPLNDIYTLRERVERGGVCAIMLECVQGEGGVWNANYDYLRDVRELCAEKGLLLICDEVTWLPWPRASRRASPWAPSPRAPRLRICCSPAITARPSVATRSRAPWVSPARGRSRRRAWGSTCSPSVVTCATASPRWSTSWRFAATASCAAPSSTCRSPRRSWRRACPRVSSSTTSATRSCASSRRS